MRIGTRSGIEPYGLTHEVYGNAISVEEIWEQGLEYPVEFNWYSDPDPIAVVVVTSGRNDAVYCYEDEDTYEDFGRVAIEPWEPGYPTFCWGSEPEPSAPPVCEWIDETAWGAGYPYNVNEQGNWGTYTPYPVIIDGVDHDGVIIWAGQNMDAGALLFSEADGNVSITFMPDDVWSFAPVEENIKIQPYDEPPPDGNPVPGGSLIYH